MASFSRVAFGCDRGLVKSDVNEGLVKVGKWPDSALREKYSCLFSWNFFEHRCLARLLTKVWGGGRGRVSKRACGGWSSGELIGNVGTGRGVVGVAAELEWVCTEVGKVGVEVRGADRVDIVAVGVVKRGCGITAIKSLENLNYSSCFENQSIPQHESANASHKEKSIVTIYFT